MRAWLHPSSPYQWSGYYLAAPCHRDDSLTGKPTAVGLDFAQLWQGMFDVTQRWNGVSIQIDVDVASMKSPSAPTP